jgi:hypothetical protein
MQGERKVRHIGEVGGVCSGLWRMEEWRAKTDKKLKPRTSNHKI